MSSRPNHDQARAATKTRQIDQMKDTTTGEGGVSRSSSAAGRNSRSAACVAVFFADGTGGEGGAPGRHPPPSLEAGRSGGVKAAEPSPMPADATRSDINAVIEVAIMHQLARFIDCIRHNRL